MSLQDVTIKTEYRSLLDNVVKEFYNPLLKEAISYQRAVGYFSSSALVEITKGILGLVKNGGKIQIVASPYLSEKDIAAIRSGYELREQLIREAIVREMKVVQSDYEKKSLNLLSNLISDGILDIKIAFTENENNLGMYHEKMGIISDNNDNKVAFSGSMNESSTAMYLNYETIDVFCSWNSTGDCDRIIQKETAFNSIWNNCEPNIHIIEFPNLKQEIIDRYKRTAINYEKDVLEYQDFNSVQETEGPYNMMPAIPENIKLHDYQIEAIDTWEKNNYRGIFDMATGTGKTYTGLGAIVRLSKILSNELGVIIVCPFQHLVEQWVEDILQFNIKPIVGYSASIQKDWKKRLESAVRDQKLKTTNGEFFCFVCTNATFSSEFVQNQINKLKSNAILLVDEAHNFGAAYLSKSLIEKFNYRLALSATLDRHNDEEGTEKLYSYFGKKAIEYTLERAINEKKLTRYKYHPIIVTLNEFELEKYADLTKELGKCLMKGKNGKLKLNEKGKIIALARARIVAGAKDKIAKLEECILPYRNDRHILIYCGSAKILTEDQDITPTDIDDLRQIDAVTDLLGNKLNMKVSQFTSKENIEERKILKKEFSNGENLQALIAIKCLDEGVNIPKIKVAFILASTTNPKEYIQRRGRVLRLAEGKEYAEIYDFITLPRPLSEVNSLTELQMQKEIRLVKNELSRAEEFASISMNMCEANSVLEEIKEAYYIDENQINFEEDFNYE
ncbi:DEAD/DEAH box helicase family protein [Acetobacterium bakii]|uniref:DNA repair protein n=1 Tax=Acetobacterium bakii TaxID=52689 RepID=A0A0L6TZN4_9FIRM|nr:DEAD/DEAH box helicase family protein [Acetobacterium bakii]KNZ41726.1 DNA repair protein [Acetobacterium bakii]